MTASLGFIEGFYGEPWSWADRRDSARFLAEAGYSFYVYAPKGDPYFRKRWREPMPVENERELHALSKKCRAQGLRFGVGLSPYELYLSFDSRAKSDLRGRLELFDRIGVDILGVLFDDMKGDLPGLAGKQVEILNFMRDHSSAKEILFCPTYYSTDPILDRIFGARPEGYLEELGRGLDSSVNIFWTGEKICSTSYEPGHLRAVSESFGRKPFIWDNYPVNDGQKMCKHLHLRAFTGRPPEILEQVSGIAVNPMNQAWLSRIPALTLIDELAEGNAYDPDAAFRRAARKIAGDEMADCLERDLRLFHDTGLDGISPEKSLELQAEYGSFSSPAAREVVAWLKGDYDVTRELVLTQ